MSVAALFVDPEGIYPQLLGRTACWCGDDWFERFTDDPSDDAREYRGPHPVVAHPPCHLWTNLAQVNFKRYGGEHNRPGNDGGCFAAALASVRKWGGVLEHPAGSRAWEAHGLLKPFGLNRWTSEGIVRGGHWRWCAWPCSDEDLIAGREEHYWVCEVWQSAYGHRARKRTWLLYCGVRPPFELDWTRKPGTHQCGWFDRKKPTLSKREASATPEPFARTLIALAEWSRG